MSVAVTHAAVHICIAFSYCVAVLKVPSSFNALTPIRRRTLVAGGVAFLTGGITHFFLGAYESNERVVVTVTDHIQAVAIILFLWWLAVDIRCGIVRFKAALTVIDREFGSYIGGKVRVVFATALKEEHVRAGDDPEKVGRGWLK
jgi:hypothetical protein